MMFDVSVLTNHKPTKDFFIAIDSDGCAFDTMEIKHKECFIPNIINHWDLQAVSKYARAAAEFVNLYSKWRGINRFPALTMVFDLLGEWDKVRDRGVEMPNVPNLRRWIETESKLGNPALQAYCDSHDEPDMHRALKWSKAVNASVAEIVRGVPPFPHVRESLEKGREVADILVCSATPGEALVREWAEHGVDGYPFAIAGQELGKKSEHIAMAAGGKYDPSHMLMIGDAEGDLKAAKANGALFFPINPGNEEESWRRFREEAMDKFISGAYAGTYEAALIAEFKTYLPETPPWKK
ncbi:MAG TPA: HAD family hydrolase [Candidatus Hydrogenedentes bacterium]|nr:HAD family hydrolase [Candidatus Hydrogenedentota bacterium]HRT19251.1 HAD family hydrolase [Candidatus Hydrogenedentota bacterium]HRT63331.1 HAD family hydrolase [Candidatus Hydrogenedentota bacterium]